MSEPESSSGEPAQRNPGRDPDPGATLPSSGKQAIRKRMIQLRMQQAPSDARRKSERIAVHLLASPLFSNARTVLAYATTRSEVQTLAILEKAISHPAKTLSLPRVTDPAALAMDAYRVTSLRDLVPGSFGIPEPVPARAALVEPGTIDLVLVPGLAFDRSGHRLGYGKGFYDVYLKRLRKSSQNSSKAIAVGVCFAFQLAALVPADAHDVAVDYVVTEDGLLSCSPLLR